MDIMGGLAFYGMIMILGKESIPGAQATCWKFRGPVVE